MEKVAYQSNHKFKNSLNTNKMPTKTLNKYKSN